MTPDQIAATKRMAEKMGYCYDGNWWWTPKGKQLFTADLPDYTTDLNQMMEVVTTIIESAVGTWSIVGRSDGEYVATIQIECSDNPTISYVCHSSATPCLALFGAVRKYLEEG